MNQIGSSLISRRSGVQVSPVTPTKNLSKPPKIRDFINHKIHKAVKHKKL
nr:MAG TPA: hypothetical protein [Caudoviricetes sp.]